MVISFLRCESGSFATQNLRFYRANASIKSENRKNVAIEL